MAAQQSKACPFKSRFTGSVPTWISPAQYLAENLLARQASRDKTELPLYFWTKDRWKREYATQCRMASLLVRLYSMDAIIAALRTPEGKRIYSFGAKWLDPLIKAEQQKLQRRKEAAPPPPQPPEPTRTDGDFVPRPAFVRNPSPISKLKDL